MPAPEGEVDVTTALVERLVHDQHPRLAGKVQFVSHGWDCDLYRLGTAMAVRIPRRSAGDLPVRNEQRWLGELARALPSPVPVPLGVGRPSSVYPWAWSIIPWFEGVPADTVSAEERDVCATQLGEFVAALHAPSPAEAPLSDYRGVALHMRDAGFRSRVTQLGDAADLVLRIWDDALGARPHPGRSWTHGDLHPGNVVLNTVDPDRGIAAVIDFGDLSGGDPAVDLAAAWLFFSRQGRLAFRNAVDRGRAYDDDVWLRARGWALDISLGLLTESDGSERMTALGRAGLASALVPE